MTLKWVVKTWNKDGVQFDITDHYVNNVGEVYCGYCTFPKRMLIAEKWHDFAANVPVHGGLTYVKASDNGATTYGFDCGHADDDDDPECRDIDWVSTECERMAEAIKLAVTFEPQWLAAVTEAEKEAIITAYHAECHKHGCVFAPPDDSIGDMMSVISGGFMSMY